MKIARWSCRFHQILFLLILLAPVFSCHLTSIIKLTPFSFRITYPAKGTVMSYSFLLIEKLVHIVSSWPIFHVSVMSAKELLTGCTRSDLCIYRRNDHR